METKDVVTLCHLLDSLRKSRFLVQKHYGSFKVIMEISDIHAEDLANLLVQQLNVVTKNVLSQQESVVREKLLQLAYQ